MTRPTKVHATVLEAMLEAAGPGAVIEMGRADRDVLIVDGRPVAWAAREQVAS